MIPSDFRFSYKFSKFHLHQTDQLTAALQRKLYRKGRNTVIHKFERKDFKLLTIKGKHHVFETKNPLFVTRFELKRTEKRIQVRKGWAHFHVFYDIETKEVFHLEKVHFCEEFCSWFINAL
jgi:hypothetical protein